jgi:hypothetical protein
MREPTLAEQTAMEIAINTRNELYGEGGAMAQIEGDFLNYVDNIDSESNFNKASSDAAGVVDQQQSFGAGPLAAMKPGVYTDILLDKALKKSISSNAGLKAIRDAKVGGLESAIGQGNGATAITNLNQIGVNAGMDAINHGQFQYSQNQQMNENIGGAAGYGVGLYAGYQANQE